MNAKVFVDTNVFIYLQSTTDSEKRIMSQIVIDTFNCVGSTHVLNEISNVLSRKAKFSFTQIGEIVDGIVQSCEIVIVNYGTVRKAHEIAQKYQFGYYDSLIISSALESNCKFLFSEDLTDGQIIEKVLTVVNIFKHPELLPVST